MEYVKYDSWTPDKLLGNVSEAILMYQIDRETFDSSLRYFNDAVIAVMGSSCDDESMVWDIKDLFRIDTDTLKKLVHEIKNGTMTSEERQLYNGDECLGYFQLNYCVYTNEAHFILQINMKRRAKNDNQQSIGHVMKDIEQEKLPSNRHGQAIQGFRCPKPSYIQDINHQIISRTKKDQPFIEDYSGKEEEYLKLRVFHNRYDLAIRYVKSAMITTDDDLNVIEWNHAAEAIFGYNASEAIGNNVVDLIVDKRNHDEIGMILSRTIQGFDTQHINENITKDGKILLCEWKNSKVVDEDGHSLGLICIVEDMTNETHMHEEIDALSTVVTQAPVAVVLTDLQGHIQYVNQSFVELTGYNQEEVIGKTLSILAGGNQTEYFESLWNTLLDGKVWEGEFKNKRKNGDYYNTVSRIFPIKNDDGELIQLACIQKDMTKEIETMNYLKDINSTLENQERLSMVGQMAAGIIHEINNPISFIDINVQALKIMLDEVREKVNDRELSDEFDDLVDDLKNGISIIKGIADGLKRFTYKSQTSAKELVDMNDEVESIIVIGKNEYKYDCELIFKPGVISEVLANSGEIKQVLLNLILNAVHAIRMKESEETGQIEIVTFEEGDWVYCTISDNGCGIPVENHHKVFESFFTTKEIGKGTGLGLALSKKMIEAHQGCLTFKSEVGIGTTFQIQLRKKDENE